MRKTFYRAMPGDVSAHTIERLRAAQRAGWHKHGRTDMVDAAATRPETRPNPTSRPEGGRRLTFSLGDEEFGIEILRVQEIIGLMPVTRMPRTPDFIRGVVNLRGKVVPVMDLRMRFGMPAVADTEKTCIVVVTVPHESGRPTIAGLIVDSVSEVVDIDGAVIEAPPDFGHQNDAGFINGLAKIDEQVVILLDVEHIVVWDGVADLRDGATENPVLQPERGE